MSPPADPAEVPQEEDPAEPPEGPPPSEFELIRRRLRGTPGLPDSVALGPGDDVAALHPGDGLLALSVDTVVETVHFRRAWSSPEDVGWKALAAALSDLAAAGVAPRGCLCAVALPEEDLAGPYGDRLAAGLNEAAHAYACPVLGGDTTRSPVGVVLSVTVIGQGPRVLTRAGARPGDLLQVSGETGWAALGLQLLDGGPAVGPAAAERAKQAHRRPRARLDLLDALDGAHAAIDISDGLLADAAHMAEASGVCLRIRTSALSPALRAAVGPRAERLAAAGGDDYELLVAAPRLLPGFVRIGTVCEGPAGALLDADGRAVPPTGRGWDHARGGAR